MAPPVSSRALRPLLLAGDLLAHRYRLVRPVEAATPGEGGPAVLWLARDEVLARPVAVKVLSAVGRRRASASERFLEAAAASGAVSHPVLARVYDAALEERPAERSGRPAGDIDVAYVISEWVEGRTLAAVLADGPWEPKPACALVTEVADALAAAHAVGLVHGRLHPGNVLIPHGGGVKLTDLAVSTVLPDRAVPAARSTDREGPPADVRDLAAILYALLTARWPASATPQPSGGLAPAPAGRDGPSRGRLTGPGQVRAGVPRALDDVVVRALDPVRAGSAPDLTTAAGFCDALDRTTRADPPPRSAPSRSAPSRSAPSRATPARAPAIPAIPPQVRRWLPSVSVLILLLVIALTSYTVGRSIGVVPKVAAPSASPPAGGPPGAMAIDLTAVPVSDFDPPPGDGRERPGSVPNAHDGDATTVWETERYTSDTFGGIKEGVGLLIDLDTPTPVSGVELNLAAPGTVVELRAADVPAEEVGGYRVLTSGRSAEGPLALKPPVGTRARYYLIWITGLPEVDGEFSAGVTEIRFQGG